MKSLHCSFRKKLPAFAALALLATARLSAQEVIVSAPAVFAESEAVERLPTIKGKFAPEFPREMKSSGEIGYAMVIVFSDEKGKNRTRWLETTVHPYRDAVEDKLQGWRVQPAERDGKPVESRFWLSVIFNPASSAASGPDATPRLLEVAPVFSSEKKFDKAITVPVELVVNEAGRPEKITAAPAYTRLQSLVEAAVSAWKFAPARKNGQPVAAALKLSVIVQPKIPLNAAKGTPPSVIRQTAPNYPPAMVSSGLRGAVTVEFVINTEGKVEDATVVESNNPGFNDEALETIRKWTFKPARMGDKPVKTKVRQLIEFRLDSGGHDAFAIEKAKKKKDTPPSAYEPDVSPKPRGVVLPVFPYELLRSRDKGSAEVRMIIDERGRIYEVTVLQSTRPEFGLALAAAVQTYTFDPALKQGKPVPSALSMKQDFKPGEVSDEDSYLLADEAKHPERIVAPKSVAEVPKAISRIAPVFPVELFKKGENGRAVIEFLIDREGRVRLPRFISATHPAFGYAAVQAVSVWQFEKPVMEGKTVALRVRLPMDFSLDGK